MAEPVTGQGEGAAARLFVLPSPEELARAAAGRLWGIARERATAIAAGSGRGSRAVAVALSGGETPRATFETLSRTPYRDRFPWELVHFFQVDERWVPPDDPRSNRRMIREALIGRVPLPPGNFHAIDTSFPDPAEGARRYEEELRAFFREGPERKPGPAGGFPRFDAVLLGLGADGHTASLFPGSAALDETDAWAVATAGGTPPLPRVTLTLPVINAAAQVVFVVSGREKAGVLRDLLAGGGGGASFPAARVSPRRGSLTVLADDAAAPARTGGPSPGAKGGGRP